MFTKGNEDYLIMLYKLVVMAKNCNTNAYIFLRVWDTKCGGYWLNEPMVWCLYTHTNELNYYGFYSQDYVCIQMNIPTQL